MYLKLGHYRSLPSLIGAPILHEVLGITDPVDMWASRVVIDNQLLPHEDLALKTVSDGNQTKKFTLFFNQPTACIVALQDHSTDSGVLSRGEDSTFHFHSLAREILPASSPETRRENEHILWSLRNGNDIPFRRSSQWRSLGQKIPDFNTLRVYCLQNIVHANILLDCLDILSGTKDGALILSDRDNVSFFPGEVALLATNGQTNKVRGKSEDEARQYLTAYLELLKIERSFLRQQYRHMVYPGECPSPCKPQKRHSLCELRSYRTL